MTKDQLQLNRRALLAGASASSAALMLAQNSASAQPAPGRAIVFTHTSVFVSADIMHDDVALAVAGGKIAAIGPTDAILQQYPGADIYDGRGKAILPGLINCHSHVPSTIDRGFNEDFGFPNSAHLGIGINQLLSPEERLLMTSVGALECIKAGTTSVVEFASGISDYAGTLAKAGLRCVFAESISDNDTATDGFTPDKLAKDAPLVFSAKKREAGLQRIADLTAAWNNKENGRIRVFPAVSTAGASSPELLAAIHAMARQNGGGYAIDLSMSVAENEFLKRMRGMTPTAYLDKSGFLGPHLIATHCRYLEDGDIALLGKARTIVSHQAVMAANRGASPPIPALRAAGCTIAYGTDNNSNDMFEVMRVALLTERVRRGDDPMPGMRPQPEDVFEDCTQGGAMAMFQDKVLGSLDIGKIADLVVLDTQRANLAPCGRILSAWIHNGQPSDIESMMVDGVFLMRSRKVLTMDESALIAEADKVGKRVWAKIRAAGRVAIPGRPKNPGI
jgi:cytosine/adenosine deaminase-related metal-dependent hydrolase